MKSCTISKTLAKVEYRSFACTLAEITWIIGLLNTLEVTLKLSVSLHYDIKVVIQIATNFVFYKRSKHIGINCYLIR